MKKEIRSISSETSIDSESRHISGYAVLFNSDSNDIGFIENIEPRALDGVIEKSDILCLLDHKKDRGILARNRYGKGSLSLSVDERGLKFEYDAPNTSLGDEVIEYIKRGDITGNSFAFTVEKDRWEKRSDGSYLRVIEKIDRLYDISQVFEPAYPDTTVALRSLEEFKETEVKEDLSEYYKNLEEKLG